MFDQIPPAHPQPRLRVAATYPATDGSCPETVSVDFNGDGDPAAFAARSITALAAVPGTRHQITHHISSPTVPTALAELSTTSTNGGLS